MMELLGSEPVLRLAEMVITLVLLKATLLVGLLAGALRLSRGASAALRSSLCSLSFVVLMVLPFSWRLVPEWYAGFLEFPTWMFGGVAAAGPTMEPAARMPDLPPAAELGGLPLASYVALVWAAGALLFLARFAWQRLHVERIARAGVPVKDPRLARLAEDAAARIGVNRRFRLVSTSELSTAAVFGVRRPVLLLPVEARGWSEEKLIAVFCHELAHVKRDDYLDLVLLEVVQALFWPNPLVRLAARRARESQDLACDDAVLRAGVPAAPYARHLVEAARTLGGSPLPAAALPLAGRSSLHERVRALLARAPIREPVARSALLRWTVLAVFAGVIAGSADPWLCERESSRSHAAAAGQAAAPTPVTVQHPG